MLPRADLTSLAALVINSLSSSDNGTSSGVVSVEGAFIALTSFWYRRDRSPKSSVVIEVVWAFNSLILIVFLLSVKFAFLVGWDGGEGVRSGAVDDRFEGLFFMDRVL